MSRFDTYVERRGTNSAKWNKYPDQDVIPAWVADMDFRSPEPIIQALTARVAHGIFGYSRPPPELIDLLVGRMEEHYGWRVDPGWFVWLPGVVPGLSLSCRCVGVEGDAVMTPTPVYYPFLSAPVSANRQRITLPVSRRGANWQFDFEQMRSLVTDRTRVFLLCNPYNPVGRILDRRELESIAAICLENDMIICSDEIHADLLLDADKPHIPTATLGAEVANRTITLISPSKTFNLAGLGGCAVAIIPDRELRASFRQQASGIVPGVSVLAYEAARVAYGGDCDDWYRELIAYLQGNRDFLEREIETTAGLSMTHVEATYLAWIDISELSFERPFERFIAHGVAPSEGEQFGDDQHIRLNFGCPRVTLEQIVERIKSAVQS